MTIRNKAYENSNQISPTSSNDNKTTDTVMSAVSKTPTIDYTKLDKYYKSMFAKVNYFLFNIFFLIFNKLINFILAMTL